MNISKKILLLITMSSIVGSCFAVKPVKKSKKRIAREALFEADTLAGIQGTLSAADLTMSCVGVRGKMAGWYAAGSAADCLQKLADDTFSDSAKVWMFGADVLRTAAYLKDAKNFTAGSGQYSLANIPLRFISAGSQIAGCYYRYQLSKKMSAVDRKDTWKNWRNARWLGAITRAAADCVQTGGASTPVGAASCVSAIAEMAAVNNAMPKQKVREYALEDSHRDCDDEGWREENSAAVCYSCHDEGTSRPCLVCSNGHSEVLCKDCLNRMVNVLTPEVGGTSHPFFIEKATDFYANPKKYHDEYSLKWVRIGGKTYFETIGQSEAPCWWRRKENATEALHWEYIQKPNCGLCKKAIPAVFYSDKVESLEGLPAEFRR